MKRFFKFIIIVSVLFCIFGKSKTERAKEFVLNHMEEKYGESCFEAGVYGANTGRLEMYVTCESIPGERIHVYVDRWNKRDRVIEDNYLIYKHWDEILEYVQEHVSKEFKNVKIHASKVGQTLSADLPADASLEQILRDKGALIYVCVDVLESDFQNFEQAKRVMSTIKNDVTEYNFMFISVEKEMFGQLTYQELIRRSDNGEIVRAAYFSRYNGYASEKFKDLDE